MENRILVKRSFSFDEIEIVHVEQGSRHLDESLETAVDEEREEIVATSKANGYPFWNGIFYRVENSQSLADGAWPLSLELGTISFKEIATIKKYHMARMLADPSHYLNPLAIASMIETSDWLFVFGKRMGKEVIDIIGGGVQPTEIPIHTGRDLQKTLEKEIREELGLSDVYISSIVGKGMVCSTRTTHLLIAHVMLNIPATEVERLFADRPDPEMDAPVFVARVDVKDFLLGLDEHRKLLWELL